jgi:DNA-binding IclR family transcriptional regulator
MTQADLTPNDDALGKPAGLVSPVGRAFRLLRYVAEGGSTANLSEVGRLIDVNRVTVMRLLATLEQEGLLAPLPQGGHRIGLDFLKLAASVVASDDLLGFARGVLTQVSAKLQLSAYLAVLDGGDVVYLLRDMPEAGLVSNVKVGSRVPAHLTTPGRIMLAHHTAAEIRLRLGPEPLPAAAGHRSGNYADLERSLQSDLERGCAWSHSGFEAGIDACAAPVFDAANRVVAAISVAGPDILFERDAGLQARTEAAVKTAALDLSRLIGYRQG